MKYMGSKAKHADQILEHVLAKRRPGQFYIEPFVGGANVMCRVPADQGPRIGADRNRFMVALHTLLAQGRGNELPESITFEEYTAIKDNPGKYDPALVGFIGTGVTFGSVWFGGFVKDPPGENRCAQSKRSCLADAPGLAGAVFKHSDFDKLTIPEASLIYCDPPYIGTSGYDGATQTIQVGESHMANEWRAAPFWQWADRMVDEGHTVFVSEYTGPKAEAYNAPITADHQHALNAIKALPSIKTWTNDAWYDHCVANDLDPYTDPPQADAGVLEKLANLTAAVKVREEARRVAAQRLADRWEVQWSKEVLSDFSAAHGADSKREVEKLFHRAT